MISFEPGPKTASTAFSSPDFAASTSALPASSGEAKVLWLAVAATAFSDRVPEVRGMISANAISKLPTLTLLRRSCILTSQHQLGCDFAKACPMPMSICDRPHRRPPPRKPPPPWKPPPPQPPPPPRLCQPRALSALDPQPSLPAPLNAEEAPVSLCPHPRAASELAKLDPAGLLTLCQPLPVFL